MSYHAVASLGKDVFVFGFVIEVIVINQTKASLIL